MLDLEQQRARVRVLIPTGFGLNCEEETAQAFRLCGASVTTVHLSDLLEGGYSGQIADFHILALIGGFAFGDHLGAGLAYANRLRHKLWHQLELFIDAGGMMLGICNGFQTMAKLGLVPGLGTDRAQTLSLASNDRLGYRDCWVKLRAEKESPCIWTKNIDLLELPSRHAEGKVVALSDDHLEQIERRGLVALRYVDDTGEPTEQWPFNPSGSVHAIAGICDPTGRIFGLMPHPDAYLYGFHHPQWQRRKLEGRLEEEGEGLRIFRNGVDYVASHL